MRSLYSCKQTHVVATISEVTMALGARAARLTLANGLSVATLMWGGEGGRRVLALHGWMDNAGTFARLVPLLSPDLRVVAVDLPGHGQSSHRAPDSQYHFVDYVADVDAVAAALGWRDDCTPFALLAHSMGAAVAVAYAAAFPARVDRLLLIEGGAAFTGEASMAAASLGAACEARHRWWQSAHQPRIYPSLEAAAQRVRDANPALTAAAALCLVQQGTRTYAEGGDSASVCFAHDPRLRLPSLMRLTEEQVVALTRAVRCPTLLIRATGDPDHPGWTLPEEAANRIVQLMSADNRYRVEHLARVGPHHLHLTAPETIAAEADAFLTAPREQFLRSDRLTDGKL